MQLCATHHELGGGPIPGKTHLDEAIAACKQGATLTPASLNSPAFLIVLKTLRGDIILNDWEQLHQRMMTVRKNWDNHRAPTLLTHNAGQGVKLDKQELLKVFATLHACQTLPTLWAPSLMRRK